MSSANPVITENPVVTEIYELIDEIEKRRKIAPPDFEMQDVTDEPEYEIPETEIRTTESERSEPPEQEGKIYIDPKYKMMAIYREEDSEVFSLDIWRVDGRGYEFYDSIKVVDCFETEVKTETKKPKAWSDVMLGTWLPFAFIMLMLALAGIHVFALGIPLIAAAAVTWLDRRTVFMIDNVRMVRLKLKRFGVEKFVTLPASEFSCPKEIDF